MKISIFSYVYKPESFLINELAESLACNHQVEVLTGIPNYSKNGFYTGYSLLGPFCEEMNGVKVIRYPLLARKSGLLRLVVNYLTSIIGALFSLFRLQKSDVTFVFATSPIFTAIPAIFFAKLRGGKIVIWLQDLWPESFFAITYRNPNGLIGWFLGRIVCWIYANTDLMLVQSNDFRTNLKKYGYQGQVEWIPNWAKEEKSNTSSNWLEELPKDKFIITFAGNIGIAQKLETLIEAIEKLDDDRVHLAIVGDGREKNRLEDRYGSSKYLKFYGRKPVGDMPYLFEKSNALAVVLKKDPAFSLVVPSKVQSYLMSGKPILASLDGAGANLVNDLNVGFVSPSEDIDALSKNVVELLNITDTESIEIGRRARDSYRKHFNEKIVINKIDELLKGLVNS